MGTLAPNIPLPMPLGRGIRRHGQANPHLRSPVLGLSLPSWKRDLVLVGLLGLLPLVFYTGIVASDDLAYLLGARHGVVPGALPPRNMLLRFMHWAPLGMVIRLLPNQPWAPGVWSLIAMTGTLLVIGALARRLGVRRTWLPIALFGLVPMNVILASVPLAEPSAALLAWLGILLCAPALLDHDQPRAPTRCLAGGLLMAMSYSAKEPAAILIPSLLLFVLVNHGRSRWAWKRAALILVGPALWVGGETLLFWHFTGDPLYHAHTLAAAERGYGPPNLQGSFTRLAVYACDYVRWLADPRSDYGPPGPLLLGGLVLLVCRPRGPAARLLLCLVLPGLLYLSVGSSSLTRFDPLQHQSRHLLPILPGMALAAGLAVERFLGHRPSWNRGLVVATTGFTLVSLVAPNRLAGRWYYAGTFEAGRRLLAEHAAGQGHSHDCSRRRSLSIASWYRQSGWEGPS